MQKTIEKLVFIGEKCDQGMLTIFDALSNSSDNAIRIVFQDESGETMTTRH